MNQEKNKQAYHTLPTELSRLTKSYEDLSRKIHEEEQKQECFTHIRQTYQTIINKLHEVWKGNHAIHTIQGMESEFSEICLGVDREIANHLEEYRQEKCQIMRRQEVPS